MSSPHRSRRAALAAVALTGLTGLVVAAAWSAGPAGARDGRDAGTNLATNPVLASNDEGWGVLSGGSGHRVAVADHDTADYAYQVDLTGTDAGVYLPQQTVSGGKAYTFAVDTRTSGTAHIQIDWYGSNGFLGSDQATAVAVTGDSWTQVSGTFTAPAGAVNSHPLEYVTGGSGTWQSTAADYELKSGGTDPTQPPSDGDTAAGNFDWGTPLPQSDEFDYTGAPDPDKWDAYGEGGDTGGSGSNCWPGHAGNGRRCAGKNQVADGYLRQTGEQNGDSAGLASDLGQKYGRWEIRARVQAAAGASGNPYHPVLITWPDSDQWPSGGEYDFFEVNVGDAKATAFLHHPSGSQDEYQSGSVDLSQWHNYGFEWTSGGLTGYLDGQEWFHDTDPSVQAPGPMHLTIQLDDFFGAGGMQKAYFDVDWAHLYTVN
ncbi:MAG: glycoside hydrolase family 16 protein [Actinocatenispora sp.]